MQDILNKPGVVLVLALCAVFGSWIIGLDNWGVALTTKNLGSLLIALGAVTGASMGHSILGPRDPSPSVIASILTAYGHTSEAIQQAPIAGTASAKAADAAIVTAQKILDTASVEDVAVNTALKDQPKNKKEVTVVKE
jgi:hypothetical protein